MSRWVAASICLISIWWAADTRGQSTDEGAIRRQLALYANARQRGDGKAQASFYSEDADEWRSVNRRALKGRAEIAKDLELTRVGCVIRSPQKTRDVNPVYPAVARAAGVQGVVVVEATIDRNGKVQNAKVLRSIPLLDQAALDAVKQWEFIPEVLNGERVPVIVALSVNFSLP
jgi:TonB family protein